MRSQMAAPQAPTVAPTAQAPQTPPQNTEQAGDSGKHEGMGEFWRFRLATSSAEAVTGRSRFRGQLQRQRRRLLPQPAAALGKRMQRINEENLRIPAWDRSGTLDRQPPNRST